MTAKYRENGTYRTKSVRDVIPNSRLASYGNYEYNEDRESVYKSDDNSSPNFSLPNFCWTEVTEPWMLPEVEKHFAWLTSGGVARSSRELLAFTLTHVAKIIRYFDSKSRHFRRFSVNVSRFAGN